MLRPGARSKKIVLVLTALVVMVAVASLMVTPAFAATTYTFPILNNSNLQFYLYYSGSTTGSATILGSSYYTDSITNETINGVNYIKLTKTFIRAYTTNLYQYWRLQLPIESFITASPGWNYWRVTFAIQMTSTDSWTDSMEAVRLSVTPSNDSTAQAVDATLLSVTEANGFYLFDYLLDIDDPIFENATVNNLFIYTPRVYNAGGWQVGDSYTFRISDVVFTQVSTVEYEQLEQMQQSNQIQQGISDTLNNGTQANQNANQQGSQAADNFNNTVGDYSDLNNALDKPEAGADFSTDFGEITQDAYNASFVASTLGALYDNPAIIYSMLLTASFCVLGYILYGKRI